MRILMVHSFHHPRGGDTTYTRDLVDLLEGAGHEVVPLAMRHPDNEPSIWEGRFPSWVDLHGAASARSRAQALAGLAWSPEAAHAAAGLVADARPDVVHVQHLHRHLSPSILPVFRRAGLPVTWTVHDYELICPSGMLFAAGAPCERCRGHRYHHAVLQRCKWGRLAPSAAVAAEKTLHRLVGIWTMVDRYLCPSRYLADTLVRFGMPADRVQHLPNFLAGADQPPSEAPGEGWLYAGRLTEEKGVQVALEAARRLPGQPFYVCGGGPMEEALRRQAADLPWVHFLGHRPRSEVAERLRAVRAVVVPSLWPENFPYAVLEAQAAGRAVVASDIGGIPEQVRPGEDGLLVPPGDAGALAAAVGGLLAQPERALALGRAGHHRVRRELGPGPHLERLVHIYAELKERGRARP